MQAARGARTKQGRERWPDGARDAWGLPVVPAQRTGAPCGVSIGVGERALYAYCLAARSLRMASLSSGRKEMPPHFWLWAVSASWRGAGAAGGGAAGAG